MRIEAAAGEQFSVIALLAHPGVVEHDDLVGVHHGVEPVGDNQQRATLGKVRQRVLDRDFAFGVGCRRGFVQHQHGRVEQHRAGDAHPLLLATGQLRVFTHHRVIATRQSQDALMNVGHARSVLDLLLAGRRPAQGNVGAHTGVDQAHLLQDKTDMPVQGCRVEITQVRAAQGDTPLAGVKKAQQQARQGRLASTGAADNGGGGARFEPQVDRREHRLPVVIAVADVLQANFAAHRRVLHAGCRLFQHRGLQQGLHAAGGCHAVVQVMGEVMQQQQRPAQPGGDQGERQHLQRRHPAQRHKQAAENQHPTQHGYGRDHGIGIGHRPHQRAGETDKGAGKRIDSLAVTALGLVCASKCLEHRHAVDELHHGIVDTAHARDERLHIVLAGLDRPGEKYKETGERQDRDHCQAPVQRKQIDQRNSHGTARTPHRGVEMRGEAVQRIDIVLYRLLDLPRCPLREPAQRHTAQAPHNGQAQMMGDAVVGQVRQQLARRDQQHAKAQAGDSDQYRPPQLARLMFEVAQHCLADMGNGGQWHQGQHGADGSQHGSDDQAPTDRGQQLADRAAHLGVGRGRMRRVHDNQGSANTQKGKAGGVSQGAGAPGLAPGIRILISCMTIN